MYTNQRKARVATVLYHQKIFRQQALPAKQCSTLFKNKVNNLEINHKNKTGLSQRAQLVLYKLRHSKVSLKMDSFVT